MKEIEIKDTLHTDKENLQSRYDWDSGKEPGKTFFVAINIFPISPFDDSIDHVIVVIDKVLCRVALKNYNMGEEEVYVNVVSLTPLKTKPRNIKAYKY